MPVHVPWRSAPPKRGSTNRLARISTIVPHDDESETLGRREIEKNEDSETGSDDHIGIDDAAPLFLASGDPRAPAFLPVALGAGDTEHQMHHGIDRHSNADVSRGSGNDIDGNAQKSHA